MKKVKRLVEVLIVTLPILFTFTGNKVQQVSVTLGPNPPASVLLAVQESPSPSALILDGAEDICHKWKGGCSPTASICWLRYFDNLGFDVIPDDKLLGDYIESPEWYETVALPLDYGITIPDCTELTTCDPPDPPMSLAGYMRTSASADGLTYGMTWSNEVMPGAVDYVRYISDTYGLPVYQLITDEVYLFDFDTVVAELGRGYPLPALGFISGSGHSWVIVGYDPRPGDTPLTAICSTWSNRVEWVEYGNAPGTVFRLIALYPVALTWEGMPSLPGLVLLFGEQVYLPLVFME